jgi:hypothetical protein
MLDTKNKRRQSLKRYRRLAVFLLFLLALWLGYKLANIERQYYQSTIQDLKATIANLNEQNHDVTQSMNQGEAKLTLCKAETAAVEDSLLEVENNLSQCEADVALYQHVMAPELSGDMLSVSVLSIKPSESDDNTYSLSMVLLQPRLQKAVISGELSVTLKYADGTLSKVMQKVPYRFKFFQQENFSISLPTEAVPEFIVFESDITQYRRVRESLYLEVPWQIEESSNG